MKQRKECLSTQNNRLSTVTRRYCSAGFSTLLQASTTISLIFKRRNSAFITGSILITLLSLSLSLFAGATILFGLNGSAYAYTISMTSSGAQSIDILPDASNVNTSISVDAVTVTTTCPAGYNLTTTTSVNDNKLYLNGSSSNNATGTYFNPSDGTTALSNAPNTWGFYQNGSTVPTSSSVFKPVPISTSTPATIRTSSSTSDSFNIYYGVAASSSLAPGTYKMIPDQNKSNENGTIVYYLTMAEECTQYRIHFNPTSTAGGTSVSGTGFMADQFATPGSPVQLNTNSFVAPSGYIFDSWNTAQDGSGIAYQDNDLAYFSAGSGDTITLFAQWKRIGLSLQGATYEDCGKTMYDNRSDNSYKDILYTTAKIDSLCWMTRNLDLPGSTTITAKDSNVINDYTLPNSSKTGFSTNTEQYVYNSGSVDCSSSSGCYSYYSFRAALAGNNSTSTSAPSNVDICPNGWRLPNRDEFQATRSSHLSAASLIAYPFASVNAGYYYNSTFSGGNTTAYYWASAGYGTNNGCSLFYNTNITGDVSVDGKAKAGGYSLRCVKDNTPSYNISFIYDNNVSSVIILDSSGSIVGTITSSGQSLPLEQYKTYTVKPIHIAGYYTTSISKTSGTGSIDGDRFTVGTGTASISITSGKAYNINFTYDSHVNDISILDDNGITVGTITASGQSTPLKQGNTYTIKPTFSDGYNLNTITKTSGAGTLNGKQFTVGAGSATLSVTSKLWDGTMQSFDCSILANTGDTTNARDTRDNEVYLIGKLADGKCWMLDNLRLDLTNSTILNGLTTSNTNVNSASLTSLKSGNRSAGNQYATSGFVKWDSSSSSNVYNQAKANADYKDTTTTSYGDGSGKIGVYYNYCAASAGSYCYDSGAGTGNAQYDLCPAGWRMPTSGSSGEYQALYAAYSSDATSFRNALSTPLPGYFSGGYATSQGSYGYFWSSIYSNTDNMYRLLVNSDYVTPANTNGTRRTGYSVRCLLGS